VVGVDHDVRTDDRIASRDAGRSSFDAFYREWHAPTVRLARLLTGAPAIAEDLSQEAFLRVYRRYGDLDNPVGFLRTVTVNVCRNWHRGRTREALRLVRHGPDPASVSPGEHELEQVVSALPFRQRAVLVLRYWADLSERDVAAVLGCRPGTVKSLHSRALARLRKEIDE
jgi:RNA polymerase sigma-70 factor (sigma-E family)